MNVQQIVSNAGAGTSIGGFAGFLTANEVYLKYGLAILTAVATITTIWVNVRKLRKRD